MSNRIQEKEARKQERLRQEAERQRIERHQRVMRRAGYAAIAAIAATLIVVAATLGGGGKSAAPADHMTAAAGGSGAAVGDKAPDFTLTNAVSGKAMSAVSLRGQKTMLFFSEGVSCQACLVQAADLQKNGALKKAGIRLVSVTTDKPSTLAQAAKQYGITTPMLADRTGQMSRAYGMLGHGGMGHATQDGHAFILLGADGKVLWHQAYQSMYVPQQQLLKDMHAVVKP